MTAIGDDIYIYGGLPSGETNELYQYCAALGILSVKSFNIGSFYFAYFPSVWQNMTFSCPQK